MRGEKRRFAFAVCRSDRARWITALGQDRDQDGQKTDRTSKSQGTRLVGAGQNGKALPLSGDRSSSRLSCVLRGGSVWCAI